MKYLDSLNWRYATKKFNPDKKVSNSDIQLLKEAIRLSASSFGLQLFKVLIIEDEKLRERLKEHSWGQPQITDASHLFVFCNYINFSLNHVDEVAMLKAKIENIPLTELNGYSDYIKSTVSARTPQEYRIWTAKQTYIALGNLLSASAELRIDSCPMEGFDADKYNEILQLSQKGLNVSVIAPVGYRAEDDANQFLKKVRKPAEYIFEEM